MKRFNVVLPKSDGGIEVYPMKEWLRQHPDHLPHGLPATSSTSHQLRDGLKKLGWTVQDSDTEVRLMMPDRLGQGHIVDDVLGEVDAEDEQSNTAEASFQLEYQLRDFIAQNLHVVSVNEQRLSLYVDPTGRDGIEFHTPVGLIDILAVNELGAFFVFELKRASSPDHAIGQVARYMGWVKQTIGKGKEVHGAIVARSISDRLRYAVSVVPNVSLFEYEVKFHLRPAHEFLQP